MTESGTAAVIPGVDNADDTTPPPAAPMFSHAEEKLIKFIDRSNPPSSDSSESRGRGICIAVMHSSSRPGGIMIESRKDAVLNNEAACDCPSAERPGLAVDLPRGTRGDGVRRFALGGVGEEGGEIDCVLGSLGGGELIGSAGDFPFDPFKVVGDRRLFARVTGGEADREVGGEAKPLPRGDTGDATLG